MANDVLNTSGTTTGNQKIGQVTVRTGARKGSLATKTYDPNGTVESAVSSIAAKYDTKFDDPRYYQGDAIT